MCEWNIRILGSIQCSVNTLYLLHLISYEYLQDLQLQKLHQSQFVFDVIDLMKHMDAWIKFPVDLLITDEVFHWGL